ADIDIEQLSLDMERFEQHGWSQFAPDVFQQAKSLLEQARNGVDPSESTAQLERARRTFEEAKNTAKAFRSRYTSLLALRDDLNQALVTLPDRPQSPDDVVSLHRAQAEAKLQHAIQSMEKGELNISRQAAEEAEMHYRRAIENLLPELADAAKRMLSHAASQGAKRYALHTYATAKAKLQELLDFIAHRRQQLPSRPADAIRLAERAEKLARKVRELRRDQASFESVFDHQRQFRLKIAQMIGMDIDDRDPLADIPEEEILSGIQDLKRQIEHERIARERAIRQLAKKHQEEMEAMRQQWLAASSQELAGLKEAFRAKLERETFERKRLEQLRGILGKEVADVYANIDGSILIRLKALKFPSGSSRISSKYKELIENLKKALELYGERTIRIEGHTDNRGDLKMNQQLSLKRAEAVRDALIQAGIDGSRLRALGYGEVRPIASNEFAKGREMNRRIDVVIEAPKK
ncbi:MAG: OmpA family protein, partial [Zetaproteobacteria bacterium]